MKRAKKTHFQKKIWLVIFFQSIGRPIYFWLLFGWVGSVALRIKAEIVITNLLQTGLHKYFKSIQEKVLQSSAPPSKLAAKKTTAPISTEKKISPLSLKKVFIKWSIETGKFFVGTTRFFLEAILSPFVLIERIITFPFRFVPKQPLIRALIVFLVIVTFLSATSFGIYEYIFKDLPSAGDITKRDQILTTKIYDRHGTELYSIYKDENRTLVKLSELPPHVINATLAIEDAQFYSHAGFSIKGILRAIKANLTKDRIEGGSTITQQLVKNTLLTSEKKLRRKIRELFLAIAVDSMFEKNQILEMYFNQIPYGGSTYGIEEASQRYFNKHAKDLSLAEAALLAGIPAAPSAYSPFGTTPELAIERQHEVLRRMVEEGFITPEQSMTAMAEKLNFIENKTPIQAPHFVMYVRSLLADMYGEDVLSQGGLEVYTSLDLDLQNKAQDIVTNEINDIKKFRISNGAALVTQPSTGEILAMVGSVNYFDFKNDGQVNLTTRLRQPGSSIKPVTYALALENGYTPSTPIVDAPISFQIPGSKPYTPKNYDGRYHGTVTLRQALANSYNIPAVKVLSAMGINRMIDKAEEMGIDTWKDRSRFGLSLTLGGGEVYMTDMAEVYGTFANQGYTTPLNPILLVKDSKGNVLYENKCVKDTSECPKKKSLDPRVAYQISNILSDNNARSSAFGLHSVLQIDGQQVAVKTGTTNSLRDNWTIGYTKDRVVTVWVGNNDNTPMSYVASGITGASPIWNKIMRTQLSADHTHVFSPPTDLIKVTICASTGTLPCGACSNIKEEYFIPGTEPQKACTAESFKPINMSQVTPALQQ